MTGWTPKRKGSKVLHAILSPSSADQWTACAAAPAMQLLAPVQWSSDADEGTAGHFLASECLEQKRDAVEFEGFEIFVINGWAQWGDAEPWPAKMRGMEHKQDIVSSYTVDESLTEDVQIYVDAIRRAAVGKVMLVEHRGTISHITGEDGAGGTTDCAIICPDTGTIEIHDLKMGRKKVNPVRNKQEALYALAALRSFADLCDFSTVKLVIHQPRLWPEPSEWVCTVDELMSMGEQLKQDAVRALSALSQERGALVHWQNPGPAQCHFCTAKPVCEKYIEFVGEAILGRPFNIARDFTEENIKLAIEKISRVELCRLANLYPLLDMIAAFPKAVLARIEQENLVGNTVPGTKMVQGRDGNRKWHDEAQADEALQAAEVADKERYVYKLISPTAAEKLLKKSPKWEALQIRIVRAPGRLQVAPADDKRPAVAIEPMFDNLEANSGEKNPVDNFDDL